VAARVSLILGITALVASYSNLLSVEYHFRTLSGSTRSGQIRSGGAAISTDR